MLHLPVCVTGLPGPSSFCSSKRKPLLRSFMASYFEGFLSNSSFSTSGYLLCIWRRFSCEFFLFVFVCLCLLCLPRCAWTVWLEWELASPRSRTNLFPSQWCACGVTAAVGWLRPFTWLSRGHTPPQAPLLLTESSPACLCAVSCYQGSFSSRHRQYCCHSLGQSLWIFILSPRWEVKSDSVRPPRV